MEALFLVLVILCMVVPISTTRRKELKLPRREVTESLSCSTNRPCLTDKFCLPFVSKCRGENNVFGKSCYIDKQCPAGQICSIVYGYCLAKPSCRNTTPYSFCRKDFCPCPDGYECRGEYNHQTCLPVHDNSGGERSRSEQTGSGGEQTGSGGEQTGSGGEQTGSEGEQTGSGRAPVVVT